MTQVAVNLSSDLNLVVQRENQAKKAVFGAFQGFIIISIIMSVLFRGAWWSVIPILASFYGFIEAVFLYQDRKNGVHPKLVRLRKDTLGSWFAFVLVSYIMSSLFAHQFWMAIPIVILFFGAIGKTIEYPGKKRAIEAEIKTETPVVQSAVQVENVQPTVIVESSQVEEKKDENLTGKYCPYCGSLHEEHSKFCGRCGQQI